MSLANATARSAVSERSVATRILSTRRVLLPRLSLIRFFYHVSRSL